MDLVERYLAAIARQLPDAQKADVTGELRDVLLSRIEDREATLGRALTDPEVEAQLIDFGHPLTISGRYRKVQHLIGPEIFPFWWAGLKVALAITLGVYVVLAVLAVLAGEDARHVGAASGPSLQMALIFAFGLVTLVCALVERFGKTALLTRWKPRNLPPARPGGRNPFELSVDIAVGVIFVLWWTGLIRFQNMLPDQGLTLALAPVWQVWFWAILANSVLEVATHLLALVRPAWDRLIESLLVIRSVTAAAILGAIYPVGHFVMVTAAQLPPGELAQTQARFDKAFGIGVGFTILVFLVLAAINLWRLRKAMVRA